MEEKIKCDFSCPYLKVVKVKGLDVFACDIHREYGNLVGELSVNKYHIPLRGYKCTRGKTDA